MKVLELQGVKRDSFGKKANKKLRKDNNVPCVLYGGKENVHFFAHENLFKELIYSPNVYIVKIIVDDKHYDAILQEIQYHPVTDKIYHIDFFEVYPDKKVTIGVPIKLYGHSIGVKEGGRLNLEHRKLKVRGLFHDLPDSIEINVEELGLGKSIKVGDIPTNKFRFIEPANIVVASVKMTRVSKDAEVTEGAEAVAEEGAEDAKKTEQTK
jgi:large subunit ribosomal protein L25